MQIRLPNNAIKYISLLWPYYAVCAKLWEDHVPICFRSSILVFHFRNYLLKHIAQNTTNIRPRTQEQTQYRRPTVKEHGHHLDSQ
jgi:hypothetical protein